MLNSDAFLQLAIVLIGTFCCFVSIKTTRKLLNPVTIVYAGFFVPAFFALYRFSGLQEETWSYNTYLAIYASVGAWLILPTILIAAFWQPNNSSLDAVKPRDNRLLITSRLFAATIGGSYIIANLIQTSTPIPAFDPNVAFIVHADFPGGIRLLARSTPAAAILCYLAFFFHRQKIDLALVAILILLPLTRLSRIDPAISLIAICCLFSFFPIFKPTIKRAFIALFAAALLIAAGSDLGMQRHNRFGMYEFSYSEMIKWLPDYKGPLEVFPILYGYFPLSFENLDASISNHNGKYTYVLYSFDWLFSGFLKLNWFTSYEAAKYANYQGEAIHGAAAVPTALFLFFKDFGPVAIILPCAIYSGLFCFLFIRSRDPKYAAMYGVYSGAFALTSFQALIASGPIAQQLAWVLLACLYSFKRTSNDK